MDETLEKFMQYVPKKGAEGAHATNGMGAANEDERSLMREVRTWFGLLVLEHMYAHCFYLSMCCFNNLSNRTKILRRRRETSRHSIDGGCSSMSDSTQSSMHYCFGLATVCSD